MHPFRHFCTITKHRHLVMRYCFRVGLIWRGLCHDLSKYSPTEFWAGAKYYLGNRSPNVAQRQAFGYSEAWMHHKGRNRHHYEYWVDLQPVEMPTPYLVEMVMDRIAASKVYKGKDYHPGCELEYLRSRESANRMHPETRKKLEFLLEMLRDEGEKNTFRYIRRELVFKKTEKFS